MTAPSQPTDPEVDGSDRSGSLSQWWAGLSRAQRGVALVLGAVLAFNVSLVALRSAIGGGDPGGPVSSAFSTGATGLEAFADLARADGHPVVRIEDPPEPGSVPTDATVVLADPDRVTRDEYLALMRFVDEGGRLVLAGSDTAPFLSAVGSPARWERVGPSDALEVDGDPEVVGLARRLAGDNGGRWLDPGDAEVHAVDDSGRAAVISVPAGEGTVIALADADLLHNEHLASADNAAFALGLAGPSGSPLHFVESVHGFGTAGIDALPSSWRWAGAGAVLALIVGLWWAGSRFGPAEPSERTLRPARSEHVTAVAADLDRVSQVPADLVTPLLAENRTALADHVGVAPDATEAVFVRAAEDRAVTREFVLATLDRPVDLAGALAAGEVAAARRRATLEQVAPAQTEGPPGALRTDT